MQFATSKNQTEQLIHQTELRRMLGGVSDMTLYRWREAGTLPQPIVIHRRNYYRRSEIDAMIDRLSEAAQ